MTDPGPHLVIQNDGQHQLVAEIVSVAGAEPDAQWWSGPSLEGQTQLTDEAVDWIDTVANHES